MRLWNSLSISHADLGEELSKSTTVIHPLLPVGRQPKERFFASHRLTFQTIQQFLFKERKRKSSSICISFKAFFVYELRWHGFWTAPCRRKPDRGQLSLSSGNYNKVIKPQVNGSSLNICRYKSDTVESDPKGSAYWSFSPKAVSDEWTSSNLIGTAPSLQPCRYSPWLCLGGCLTMTKKLNLFRVSLSPSVNRG